MDQLCDNWGIPDGIVKVSIPSVIKGDSFPIVHCIRHRRRPKIPEQYTGTQQDLHQEYINLTRGVEKNVHVVGRRAIRPSERGT